ncbi:hypothetical protein QYE76_022354 [Lolium multiflorum]|uniref:Retrotransposon gag domain-containing protein n=1 Tax=Lolium multiflorum TaxID=4521 RepID=A0AAD8R9F8_LOLMU|nr:hypothetical protein QYE76_022354 [Lolium multiflorum]
MDAEDWLMDTERKLRTVGCNDEEKIRYATYLLSGPAASWWENVVAVHPPERVFTWEEFKKKFRDAHVPESVVELKKMEFDELQQNAAPIMQYVRDFNRLSRYVPEEVNSDEKRKRRFMKDCDNEVEANDGTPEGDYELLYEEPDLSGGVERVDYGIVYGDDNNEAEE